MTSASTVTAVGSTRGNIFLAPKANNTIAAFTGLGGYFNLINKNKITPLASKECRIQSCACERDIATRAVRDDSAFCILN